MGKGDTYKPGAVTLAYNDPALCLTWMAALPFKVAEMAKTNKPMKHPERYLAEAIRGIYKLPDTYVETLEAQDAAARVQADRERQEMEDFMKRQSAESATRQAAVWDNMWDRLDERAKQKISARTQARLGAMGANPNFDPQSQAALAARREETRLYIDEGGLSEEDEQAA